MRFLLVFAGASVFASAFVSAFGVYALVLRLSGNPGLTVDYLPAAFALVAVYFVVARRNRNVPAEPSAAERAAAVPHRVLIVANETVGADDLLAEIRRFASDRDAEFFVCVPANPVDTGQAEHKGAVYLWEATRRAAQERLDATLEILRSDGLRADGAVGDYRPMVAIDEAVAQFQPDGIVISTHPVERSAWLRDDLVARAARKYDVPVDHIVAHVPAGVGEA